MREIHASKEIGTLHVICDDVGYKTPNFTTSGIYRLHGTVSVHNGGLQAWSIIVKVIKPESDEKNVTQHHNYWRREALIFASDILEELPNCIKVIKVPRCYLVEEQCDDTIWIWMEQIEGTYATNMDQFFFIARQLGQWNGAYMTGYTALPQYDWLCQAWLKSWTTASLKYAPDVETYINGTSNDQVRAMWIWYQNLIHKLDEMLHSLEQLPRVLAHQDLSQMNMFIVEGVNANSQLALIDWQFMSISGVGEDLGKLFGVNMSLGIIQQEQYDEFQTTLYDSYLEGLRAVGWQGEECLVRYGFCLSMALRAVWEVPQYVSLLAQLEKDPTNQQRIDRINRLQSIISIQQDMYTEVEFMRSELDVESILQIDL
ncbi:hypothetical protein JCM10914_2565 [Paenibacillus sp. JCM 10914]|nr:hypothetical protein JCM10914_2565 [Paenibacillus sp. JCM 10914]